MTNWDAIRSWKEDRPSLEYAALDAGVSYCAHVRLMDLERSEAHRLEQAAADVQRVEQATDNNDAPHVPFFASGKCAELCDTSGNVLAVVKRADMRQETSSGVYVAVNVTTAQLMAPAAKVFFTEASPHGENIFMADIPRWKCAVAKADSAAPTRGC
jgi:hypothetical protein